MSVNEEMNKMQKSFEKTRDELSGKLNNLSFDSAKESLNDLTRQAQHATSDMMGQAQRLNENVSKQAAPRIRQYSEFVTEHPITATVCTFLLGFALARWTMPRGTR